MTTAHQNPSGMDLKCECGDPASAKYTVLEKRTTPGIEKTFVKQFRYMCSITDIFTINVLLVALCNPL